MAANEIARDGRRATLDDGEAAVRRALEQTPAVAPAGPAGRIPLRVEVLPGRSAGRHTRALGFVLIDAFGNERTFEVEIRIDDDDE